MYCVYTALLAHFIFQTAHIDGQQALRKQITKLNSYLGYVNLPKITYS